MAPSPSPSDASIPSLSSIIASLPSTDDWGPATTTSTLLDGVPYAPYSKGDKLGHMADWTAEGKEGRERAGGGRSGGTYNRGYRDQQVYGAGTSSLFAAQQVAEDESSFSVVDNARSSAKTRGGYGRGGGTAVFGRGGRGAGQRGGQAGRGGPGGRGAGYQRLGGRGGQQGGGQQYYDGRGGGQRGGNRGNRRFGWKDYDKPARNRDASVQIKPEWKMLEEVDFNRLGKLNLDTDEGEDLDSYGFLYYYDRSYDKQPVKNVERKLNVTDRLVFNTTTTVDPVIHELADKDEAAIFATDTILSVLMCAPRSVYPWDITIVRDGNKIFLDKRDNSALDTLSVNENAADAPLDPSEAGGNNNNNSGASGGASSKDSINSPQALGLEATFINHNFATQTVLESESSRVDMAHANPFYNSTSSSGGEEALASKAYRYRRFDLSLSEESPLSLIVRCELDAVVKNSISGEDQFLSIKALNEFDSKAPGSGGALDWRTKLVSQRGAVVATEMKNNSAKLARWTTQAILARADVMKLGFVSRQNPKSNEKHVILGVVGYKPREFAGQMGLNTANGWGIVRTVVDLVRSAGGGEGQAKFVLVKDPNKPLLRLYEVPMSTFEEDEDEGAEGAGQGAEEEE